MTIIQQTPTQSIRQRTPDDIAHDGDWDEIVEAIKHENNEMDEGRFTIGDYVLSVVATSKAKHNSNYGRKVVEKLAMDTQMKEGTLKNYRVMSDYYRPDYRDYIRETYAVNYSVMKVAKGAGKDVEDAIAFLEHCSNKDDINTIKHYEFELARYKGKPEPIKKVARATFQCTRSEHGRVTFHATLPFEDQAKLELGKKYIIDIYPVEIEETTE